MPPSPPRAPLPLLLFAVLGALLSFTLEPLVGRLVVPYYGGAVHVWTVCMMVFQGLLLAGYAWAHLVAHRIGAWHLGALVLAVVWLPIGFSGNAATDAPMFDLVTRLLVTIAVPFWVLTTTSVVAQTWLARSGSQAAQNPYPLYAASNVGSLGGLLAYPFLVEPLLGLTAQRWVWSLAYLAYLAVAVWSWRLVSASGVEAPTAPQDPSAAPTARQFLGWIVFSAGPSALLLAVTNLVGTEVGSFPLVWVVPLALYLATFIWAFRGDGLSDGWIASWPDALLFTALFCCLPTQLWMLPLLYLTMTWTALVFHGALYRMRPHPRWLTTFYLALSLGGWLGGLAVSLGGPLLLSNLWEGPLTTAVLAVAGLAYLGIRERTFWSEAPLWLGGPRLAGRLVAVTFLVVAAVSANNENTLHRQRNFYGVFRVVEQETPEGRTVRLLAHGQTLHGAQYLDAPDVPLTYYHRGGPLHEALELTPAPRRAAVVGLGTGAIAELMQPSDEIVFYEIDPDNETLARRWFTYLDNSPAQVSVRVGDARLVMEHEADQVDYDVLMVDAFSGDGIPLSLLTYEGFQVWAGRVRDDGLLVFHLSNRFYDLRAIVGRVGSELGWSGVWVQRRAPNNDQHDPMNTPALVVTFARDPARLDGLRATGWQPLPADRADLWTDEWSTVLIPLWHSVSPRVEPAPSAQDG